MLATKTTKLPVDAIFHVSYDNGFLLALADTNSRTSIFFLQESEQMTTKASNYIKAI